MFPILFQIGPLKIYSYGLMLAIAVFACSFLLSRDAKTVGIKREVIFDFVFWVVLNGILGARLFFIILNLEFFIQKPLEIIMLQKGGLAWQGGFIGGLTAGFFLIKKYQLPPREFFDLAAPYLALGQAIGRIGCFLNGCCYGRHFDSGIYFPVHMDRLYPTQMYESAVLFFLFWILRKLQKRKIYAGQVFIYYLFFASILRFNIEFLRADHDLIGAFSIYQWISLGIFIFAGILNYKLRTSKE